MPSVVATIRVKEDKVDEAKRLFAQLSKEVLDSEDGTLVYTPHQRPDEPTTFIFFEKYADDEAFKIHGKNLAAHGKKFAGVMAGPPEIIMLEEV